MASAVHPCGDAPSPDLVAPPHGPCAPLIFVARTVSSTALREAAAVAPNRRVLLARDLDGEFARVHAAHLEERLPRAAAAMTRAAPVAPVAAVALVEVVGVGSSSSRQQEPAGGSREQQGAAGG